jgi:hypothetical protein
MSQSADLQRQIVELIHPGQEFCPGSRSSADRVIWDDGKRLGGLRLWNNEKQHKRKFLLSKGKCRSSLYGQDFDRVLTFWGEWEPQSRFRKLVDGPGLPSYIHTPVFLEGSGGKHNTDPFVFGTEFWFTNCQQPRYPFLRALPVGSLIIFGTAYKRGFALDTVFVVGERITPAQYHDHPAVCPYLLRLVTLDHLNMAQRPENQGLVFYRGKRPADGKPFSFVPCRLAENADIIQGHDRVILSYKEFDLLWGKKSFFSQGCGRLNRGAQAVSEDAILKFWKKIAVCCQTQQFLLGHSIEPPPIEVNEMRIPVQ